MIESVAILDTNVVSYLFRHDTRAAFYAAILAQYHTRMISFQTSAELAVWTMKFGWGRRRLDEFSSFMEPFGVIYPSEETCRYWATIRLDRSAVGRPISPEDAWIAATALDLACPLVTHNPADFEGIAGLDVISAPTAQ